MRISIRVIEIFVRVVESGSFVAAARSLLIDPAAVSRTIKGLEETLGVLLLTRSTRVLKLTAEGRRFYRDGSQMLRRSTRPFTDSGSRPPCMASSRSALARR